MEIMQVAHFFGISPVDVINMPPAVFAYSVGYASWYAKEMKERSKSSKGGKETPKRKRRSETLAERKGKGGVANG